MDAYAIVCEVAAEVRAIILMFAKVPQPIKTEDRRVLEQIILPDFAKNQKFQKILFVGCEKYTWQYKQIFHNKRYWTIEPKLRNAVFGSKHHIISYLSQIDRYFKDGSLDLIICNGVVGYGLNDPQEIEDSFEKCYRALKPAGILVLGWNNKKEWDFLPLERYKSLQKFQLYTFPPLKTSKYETKTENRHTFSFYIKPLST